MRPPLATLVRRAATLAALLTIAGPPAARAQRGRGSDSTNRGLPLVPTTPLRFTTDEGTWLELDLSPDGRTIVFDLLGDLYTLPIEGGKATRITSGQAFDAQPHYSPDGKSIVFVSDRSGSDNLWIVNADGSHPRALTRETDQKFQSPTYTPDGKYVITSRGNDLYMYYANAGIATGIRMTGTDSAAGRGAAPGGGRGGGPPNVFLGPAVSRDGRYVYMAMRNSAGGGYNQTSLGWQIGVLDRETGRIFTKTNAVGSGMRPELSPDGRWLAYATRNNADESLILRDLATGDERLLLPKVQRDDQESRPNRDVFPTFAFTPDSKSIVIGHHGHFWLADVATGHETRIPFTADIDMMIAGPTREAFPYNDSTITVRQIRDVAPSPDGHRLAFTALDRLWIMDLPNGTPKRLVPSENVGEFEPTWSPDGRDIAYVTWNDVDGGTVSRVRADGGQPEKLSAKPAYYEKPAYSLDGRRIVVGRGPRNMRKDLEELERPPQQAVGVELVWLPATGTPGAETVISPISTFGRPHFVDGDSTHVYFSEGTSLVSMRWDGTDQKTILRTAAPGGRGGGGQGQGDMVLAPQGDKVLVQVEDQGGPRVLLIDDVPKTGTGATINVANLAQSEVPVRKLTTVGGEFATWSHDGRKIYYALGHSLFTYDLAAMEAAVRDSIAQAAARGDTSAVGGGRGPAAGNGGSAAARPIYEAARHDVVITVAKDKPRGVVALRGARILTMKEHEIIPKGDIVVKDNRIVAVGPQGKVDIPSGAKIIDVSGKTIIPGYVDIHAHMWPAWGIHRSQPFEYLINLAYGVTTTRDPQTSTTDVLSYSDMVETGDFIGPRIFSTGPGVFAPTNIRTLDDARTVLKKYSEFYNTETIKQYMTGDRRVRQLLIMAAREQHLMPTLEGGLDFKKNLTEALDGYAGSEHTLPIAPLYKDVLTLYANSGTTWTPTLIVEYGGPWAENYWYETTDVVDDPKLNRFTPRDVVERKALRRPGWWAPSQWSFQLFAEQAAKVVAAGGHVGMGSHGQLQGLGAQWEIWDIASGGMPRYDVLRVATIFGAQAIGHEKDLGSLEAGKLADLQVLDKNPLDDIKNTNTIRYVMKNGRLYDANTMNELWPRQKQVARLWWWPASGVAGAGQDR